MSEGHESQQEVREPIEIGQSSQTAGIAKEMKKWLEIIKDQRASGLSALAYCKREGITNTTFYYWQNQIQKLLIQQHEQQEKAKALPAAKPASQKPVANAKKADMQSSELLKRTLCVLRDVFPAC